MTQSDHIIGTLDSDVLQYVRAQAATTGKTLGQVASAIIRRELTKSA
jgi:adenylyl- and sulfurtransferase ThiI